ncbi:hypothetical protein ACTMTJ_19000 [Phytohabitans sp. LJ34]|uniref:hypothetical protein n=1 Tax=Phytohabitans sp. LJ34 TaxID=3452217 RepID=UPI003F8BBC72
MGVWAKRKLFVIPAVAAVVFGAIATGHATAAAEPVATAVNQAQLDPVPPLVCEGKAQLSAVVLTETGVTTIGETGVMWNPLTFATVDVDGPAGAADTDQLVVTFTGEADLTGQPNLLAAAVDAMQVRVLVDGAVQPPGAVNFTTDAGQSDALEVCAIVTGPGPHTVEVEWRLVDVGANNMLTGTLDSWSLHVERND